MRVTSRLLLHLFWRRAAPAQPRVGRRGGARQHRHHNCSPNPRRKQLGAAAPSAASRQERRRRRWRQRRQRRCSRRGSSSVWCRSLLDLNSSASSRRNRRAGKWPAAVAELVHQGMRLAHAPAVHCGPAQRRCHLGTDGIREHVRCIAARCSVSQQRLQAWGEKRTVCQFSGAGPVQRQDLNLCVFAPRAHRFPKVRARAERRRPAQVEARRHAVAQRDRKHGRPLASMLPSQKARARTAHGRDAPRQRRRCGR